MKKVKVKKVWVIHEGTIKMGFVCNGVVNVYVPKLGWFLPRDFSTDNLDSDVLVAVPNIPTEYIAPRTKKGKQRLLEVMCSKLKTIRRYLEGELKANAEMIESVEAELREV